MNAQRETLRAMTEAVDAPKRVVVDRFLSDTEAESLGLYLGRIRTPAGEAPTYSVYRNYDHEKVFAGTRVAVRTFLRGYHAAMTHPALKALDEVLATTDGCCDAMDAASAVVDALLPGGESMRQRKPFHILEDDAGQFTNCGIETEDGELNITDPACRKAKAAGGDVCLRCLNIEHERAKAEGLVAEDSPALDPPWWEAR